LYLIVIYKLLKRHPKSKHRAPAYSRVLHQIREVVSKDNMGGLGPLPGASIAESTGVNLVLVYYYCSSYCVFS